jgi:hypothetical protein
MNNNDPHHHSKTSHNVLDKLSNKISAIKEDIAGAVKERSRAFSSDRHRTMTLTSSSASMNTMAFSLQDDTESIKLQTGQLFKTSGKC